MRVLCETSRALPLVSAVVAFRSGSAHDPIGKEGLARLTARMLRRGAGSLSADEVEAKIDSLGGEFGADVSASVSSVHLEVITRQLAPFADLVKMLLGEARFDSDELERLKREAKAELLEARDSDRSLASRAFRRTLFDGHPYGRRVAGSLASIDRITREDVVAFAKKHYTQENAVVALSGDIEGNAASKLAETLVSGLPTGERVADPVPEPTMKPGRHLVFVDKPERTQLQMVWGALGSSPTDDDHFEFLVGNTAFGGTFTSILMHEVRVKRGFSYGASSRSGIDRRREAFTVWAASSLKDAKECLLLELSLAETVRKEGIEASKVSFVQSYLKRSQAFEIDTPRKRVHQPLEEELYGLPDGYHAHYIERILAVTPSGVNRAMAKRLPSEDIVIAVVGTYADIGKALETGIPDLASTTVVPFDFE